MSSLTGFLDDTSVKGRLSLDRCTFLIYSPRLSLWGADGVKHESGVDMMARLTERLLKDNFDPDFPQGIPSELFRRHYRTSDGVDIQFGPVMPKRKKITDEAFVMAFGSEDEKEQGFCYRFSPNDYGFRVEYNPNDTGLSSVTPLLQYFSSSGITASLVRIARLDLAVDYAIDINPALALCDRMRKSFIACGSSGIETVYFGSRASQYYIRLYNKAVELREKQNQDITGPLWRFELESKKSFPLDRVPDFGGVLQRFSFYSGGVSSGDWKLDLLLAYAKDNGLKAALSFLPSATAKRYRKYLEEFDRGQSIEPPYISYCRDFQSRFSVLRMQILSALGHNFFDDLKNEAVS